MRDIGEVVYGYPEKRRYERLNGRDAAQVEVYKSSTANIVDVGLAITEELRKIEAEYAGIALDIEIVRNRATDVLDEANRLVDSALQARSWPWLLSSPFCAMFALRWSLRWPYQRRRCAFLLACMSRVNYLVRRSR